MGQTIILPIIYKGFQGNATYDDYEGVWFGRLINIGMDLVKYEAGSYNDLIEEYKKSVDNYIEEVNARKQSN